MLTDLVAIFPDLATEPYLRTSPCTNSYNCFAYAAGDQSQRWDIIDPWYWPAGLPKRTTVGVLIRVFRTLNYQSCDGPALEAGFEKIVIYGKGNMATHAARQLPDGQWSSKLGDLDDITHTLAGIAGDVYGQPLRFMRRALPNA